MVYCVLLPALTSAGSGPLCSSRCCHTLPSIHLCSGYDPALLWIHGEEGPQPKPCYGPGRELRKASRSGAGWWTFEKPSSPTPCLCKQTLVGPFSAPGTSLRNTGDWLQLYRGGPGGPPSQLQLFCPLPPCRAGFYWVEAQHLQRLTQGLTNTKVFSQKSM